jgi:hypothetical protein
MTETPADDVDQDAEAPVGAPAPDPGGEPASPADESEAGRVEPPGTAGGGSDD